MCGATVEGKHIRKGANGVSTNGVTANFMCFDRGTCWVLPLPYVYLPKSARVYPFPQSVKNNCSCSGPISVHPICPKPVIALALMTYHATSSCIMTCCDIPYTTHGTCNIMLVGLILFNMMLCYVIRCGIISC